jgi:predicted hydrocarbon binding protein/KaiC/GvpD/RAD55 family RecA-like ATPase
MEGGRVSLADIQQTPKNSLILLSGPPGAGKSTFCHQAVLNGLAVDRPVIFVTTEHRPSEVAGFLKERGMGEPAAGALTFVDAFGETVGVGTPDRPDTIGANCEDLNSISMAITRLRERTGRRNALLAFDSLTSPYLFNSEEMFKFMRLCLLKFASEGNSVVACMDEGCGKQEDLVAMMSVSDGVIRMEIAGDRQLLSVVKHPRVRPTTIEVPVTVIPRAISSCFDREYMLREAEVFAIGPGAVLRPGVGDYVNIAWRDLIFWSGMMWDPKRFGTMMYDLTKYSEDPTNTDIDSLSVLPWHLRLLLKLVGPSMFRGVKNVSRALERFWKPNWTQWRIATLEFLSDISETAEYHMAQHEHYECWGLENVGTSLAIMKPAMMAGMVKGMEELLGGRKRDWNVVETKCMGRGDPYCEVKMVPGEIAELERTLEKDSEVIERVHDRLMGHLMGFMLQGKPLMERPTLGSGVHIHEVQHVTAAPLVNERLRTVFRMGGARTGKMLGERLVESGLGEDEAVRRVLDLMEHCKVGAITLGETIRITENCERYRIRAEEPSCYFTTGFLNGLFSSVKGQHVREIKCIAAGDPYCEWEIL